WDQAVLGDEVIPRIIIERNFVQESQRVHHNQQNSDERARVTRLRVPEWKHLCGSESTACALFKFGMRAPLGARHERTHIFDSADAASRAQSHTVERRHGI